MNQTDNYNYNNRCTAFNLSEAKRQTIASPTKKKAATTKPTDNAYERAYKEIFDKLPTWRKAEIVALKKTGNTTDRFYMDFIKEIATLGDQYYG